jgi:hypothetical protein
MIGYLSMSEQFYVLVQYILGTATNSICKNDLYFLTAQLNLYTKFFR